MGLTVEPENSGIPVITMLKKKGKRHIENANELMQTLQRAFPWAAYEMLDGEAVASMPIREQASSEVITVCLKASWQPRLLADCLYACVLYTAPIFRPGHIDSSCSAFALHAVALPLIVHMLHCKHW